MCAGKMLPGKLDPAGLARRASATRHEEMKVSAAAAAAVYGAYCSFHRSCRTSFRARASEACCGDNLPYLAQTLSEEMRAKRFAGSCATPDAFMSLAHRCLPEWLLTRSRETSVFGGGTNDARLLRIAWLTTSWQKRRGHATNLTSASF